jgi:hypothetical protein
MGNTFQKKSEEKKAEQLTELRDKFRNPTKIRNRKAKLQKEITLKKDLIINATIKEIDNSIPIFALSDIHADIDSLIIVLRDCAKVIKYKTLPVSTMSEQENLFKMLQLNIWDDNYLFNLNYEWIGNDANVVIIGDIIDGFRLGMSSHNKAMQYPQVEIKILYFINQLNLDIQEQGKKGIIYKLLGNHELMNFIDPTSANNYIFENIRHFNDTDKVDCKNFYDDPTIKIQLDNIKKDNTENNAAIKQVLTLLTELKETKRKYELANEKYKKHEAYINIQKQIKNNQILYDKCYAKIGANNALTENINKECILLHKTQRNQYINISQLWQHEKNLEKPSSKKQFLNTWFSKKPLTETNTDIWKSRKDFFYISNYTHFNYGLELYKFSTNGTHVVLSINKNIFVHGSLIDMEVKHGETYAFNISKINYIINNYTKYNKEYTANLIDIFTILYTNKDTTYYTADRLKKYLDVGDEKYYYTLVWNRTYGAPHKIHERIENKDKGILFCLEVNNLIKQFFNITDITNERIIIGHCIQSDSSLYKVKDQIMKQKNTTLKTLEEKTEIIEIYNNREVYTGIAQLNSLENNIFGITCECEKPDQALKDFSIYKVDIGSSRAFDTNFPLEHDSEITFEHYLTARTPQVLKIFNDSVTTNNKIQIIRSTVKNTLNNMARPEYAAHIAKYRDDEVTIHVSEEVAKSGESAYDRKMRLGEA